RGCALSNDHDDFDDDDDFDQPRRRRGIWDRLWWNLTLPGLIVGDFFRRQMGKMGGGGGGGGALWWWRLTAPFRWTAGAVRWFAHAVLGDAPRDWWHLLQGIPAAVIIVCAVAVVVTAERLPQVKMSTLYARAARGAYQKRNFEAARLLYQRLILIDQDKEESRFLLARTLAERGKQLTTEAHDLRKQAENQSGEKSADLLARAEAADQERNSLNRQVVSMMSVIAPLHRPGHADAHFWMARYSLAQAKRDPAALAKGVAHLKHAIDANDKNLAARALLSQLYLSQRKYDLAEPHLRRLVRTQPGAHLSLAFVYRQLGRKDDFRDHALAAATVFKKAARGAKSRDSKHRFVMAWAQAAIFLDDYQKAEQAILFGKFGTSGSLFAFYRQQLGRVYHSWSMKIRREDPNNLTDRVDKLLKSFEEDPNYEPTLQDLVILSKGRGPQADLARETLSDKLTQPNAPAAAHLIVGTDAWLSGNSEAAKEHLKIAFESDRTLIRAANNLAWLLMESDPPELERALQLCQAAVEQQPGNHYFRDTRGQIYAKLGRYDDARRDLEFALEKLSDSRQLHETLAEVYGKLKMTGMAEAHRRRAIAIPKKPETPKPNKPKPKGLDFLPTGDAAKKENKPTNGAKESKP
ncbi:MAG: tetratricopeptide repeat protein, partial [Planctomycetales bacterium]